MERREIEQSIVRAAGGALVTISDVAAWSGRSREFVRYTLLKDIEKFEGRYYYAGDVAREICRRART